ncbi:MAG: hypothetical protein HQL51_12600 [Magnetococcales bacterium]|nr:hypothetical protein [Magnetococcales bacterium]
MSSHAENVLPADALASTAGGSAETGNNEGYYTYEEFEDLIEEFALKYENDMPIPLDEKVLDESYRFIMENAQRYSGSPLHNAISDNHEQAMKDPRSLTKQVSEHLKQTRGMCGLELLARNL